MRPTNDSSSRGPGRRRWVGAAPIALLLAVVASTLACRTAAGPPAPFTGPDVVLAARSFSGSPLGDGKVRPVGPDAEPEPEPRPEEFDAVTARVFALESYPDRALEPAAGSATLFSPLDGADLLLPAARWTVGARYSSSPVAVDAFEAELEDGTWGRAAPLGVVRGAVAPGRTVGLRLEDARQAGRAEHPFGAREVVEVLLHRHDDGTLESGLSLLGATEADDDDERAPSVRREIALFPVSAEEGAAAFAVVAASPFGRDAAALAFVVHVSSGSSMADDEEHAAAVARAREELLAGRLAIAPPPAPLPLWPGAREALGGLERPGDQRSALAYLAGRAGAPVAEDSALTGADGLVDRIARAVVASIEEAGVPVYGDELAWRIERSAYEQLIADARADEPVATAVLVRHAGELGRFPDVLLFAVRDAHGIDDLDRRLVDENRAYLTDLDPAARVRAHDWLAARGEAYPGFDPLGSREERRAAILRAVDAREKEAADE